jgi:hypothetical protein
VDKRREFNTLTGRRGNSEGLVANGIHEALNYLAIVKKVIEKTERAVSRRSHGSDSAELPTGETLV